MPLPELPASDSSTPVSAPDAVPSAEATPAALPRRERRAQGLGELFRVAPPEPQDLFLAPPTLLPPELELGPAPGAFVRLRSALARLGAVRLSLAFLAQALVAFSVTWVVLFHLSVVRGSSMTPGIHDGDRIVVDQLAYVFGDVHRGDVVVLKYPLDPSVDYIKRIIGLPGDEVTLENGRVWVNGEQLAEPYIESSDPMAHMSVRVKPAHFFVLGDNRPRSSDSRDFGLVPRDYVRGRVEVRLWPPARIGAVQ